MTAGRARLLAGLSAAAAGAYLVRRTRHRARYSFRDRTVIVTGGSRGVGLAMARLFAADGARLWLVARSGDALEQAARELERHGTPVRTMVADVTSTTDIHRLVSAVVHESGTIDVIVNNAGMIEVGPVEHAHEDDFQTSMAVHFWGPLHLIRAALPHMRRGGEGRIVNISSVGGRIAVPHLAAYAAGKFALTGLSETLRAELMKEGIRVTTVTPGLMRTGSYVNAMVRGRHRDELRWFTAMSATPLTSMRADRAARLIVDACRAGRATVTPGWQARAAVIVNALAPNTLAAISAAVDRWALPQPAAAAIADHAQSAAVLDPGSVKSLLSEETRRKYHQPEPAW